MLNRTCSEFDVITHSVVEKFPPAKNEKKKLIYGILRKDLTCEEKEKRMVLSGGHLTEDCVSQL